MPARKAHERVSRRAVSAVGAKTFARFRAIFYAVRAILYAVRSLIGMFVTRDRVLATWRGMWIVRDHMKTTKQYLIRITHGNGTTELAYATGTVDGTDPDDRPVDAAIRSLKTRFASYRADGVRFEAVIDNRGKLVYYVSAYASRS